MHIAVCDDELSIRTKVMEFIYKYNKENNINFVSVHHFECGEELLDYYNIHNQLDIIFIDIEMREINGIDTVDKLREKFPNLLVIFVTSYMNYAPDTFRVGVFHIIRKPIEEATFFEVYKKAINKYNELHKNYTFSYKGSKTVVEYKDIAYIESRNRHLYIVTTTMEYECVGKIGDIEEQLGTTNFIRCHQGYLINMAFIKNIGKTDIALKTSAIIPLSKYKRKEVIDSFNLFLTRSD